MPRDTVARQTWNPGLWTLKPLTLYLPPYPTASLFTPLTCEPCSSLNDGDPLPSREVPNPQLTRSCEDLRTACFIHRAEKAHDGMATPFTSRLPGVK